MKRSGSKSRMEAFPNTHNWVIENMTELRATCSAYKWVRINSPKMGNKHKLTHRYCSNQLPARIGGQETLKLFWKMRPNLNLAASLTSLGSLNSLVCTKPRQDSPMGGTVKEEFGGGNTCTCHSQGFQIKVHSVHTE